MSEFIPGLELNREFFKQIVKPIMNEKFPELNYSAARIGSGSDVLGYDTERSTDHDWGLRLEMFLEEDDYANTKDKISKVLSENLPEEFRGYSTHFGEPDEKGVKLLETVQEGMTINHRIEFHTFNTFFEKLLGVKPTKKLASLDWLAFPEQRLLAVTRGEIYHDPLVQLEKYQKKFSYYPNDVWYYLMMRQWKILAEEMAFPGREAELSDTIGLNLIIATQVNKLLKLCFLQERQYAPYNKWFGTGFSELNISSKLVPALQQLFDQKEWTKKEEQLIHAYTIVAENHNNLKITDPIEIKIIPFFNRPYLILDTRNFEEALKKKIYSKKLVELKPSTSAINQISNETFILDDISSCKKIIDSLE